MKANMLFFFQKSEPNRHGHPAEEASSIIFK